jgi:hypothetical protein
MVWPTSIATNTDLHLAKNDLQTTLSGSISSVQTSLTLASTAGWPTDGFFTIDSEIIRYIGLSGATVTGLIRGFDGTTAASHTSGTAVKYTVNAAHHNALKDEIINLETNLAARIGLGSSTQLLTSDGALLTPSRAFLSDPDTGDLNLGPNIYGIVTGGLERLRVDNGGRVGVGVSSLTEKLEVAGAIVIGNATGTADGTIRWTGSDFEGRKSGSWTSLTSPGNISGWTDGGTVVSLTTLTDDVGIGTATPNSKLHVDGTLAHRFTTITGNATLGNHYTVYADATSGSFTITLPDATAISGRIYIIKKIDASANTVTVDGFGSQTIDENLTHVLTVQHESYSFYSDGSNWRIN